MNRKKFITLWIAAALLASCSSDWEPDMQPCEQQSIRLTAVATATPGQTRAASTDDLQNTAFAAGEDVAVYMVDCDGNPTYTATPYRYRASAAVSGQNELTYYSDATTPSLLCYPIDAASNVDVYAFYPYSRFASIADRETSDLDVTVSTDQSTAANYRASDVMIATPVTDHSRYPKDDNTINLQFRHVMARLVIRLKQGVHAGTTSPITASELAGTAITIGSVATEATMNMTTGAVTAGDNAATVTVAYNTDIAFYYNNTDAAISTTEYAIVLPAQTLSAANAITIITGDGETISGTLPDIDLTAGSSTVLTLTVNDSGIEATRESYGNGGDQMWKHIPGAIEGEFSVSASEQVYFSRGNLQYTTTGTHQVNGGGTASGTWQFAEHQWDVIGSGNNNMSATYEGWIDLFTWGSSGESRQPYASMGDGDTNGWSDWGVYNAISNGGNTPNKWRTMTKDEWDYLLNTREASTVNGTTNSRYAKATVNGVSGLILFPDSYTHPDGVTQPTNINNASIGYTSNSYSDDNWSAMESVGAVFLPVTGSRPYGSSNVENQDKGLYWNSSGALDGGMPWEPRGCYIRIDSSDIITSVYDRHCRCFAVRLVQNVQ